jgi:hypothetical protein
VICALLSQARSPISPNPFGSPKPHRFALCSAKAVPSLKMLDFEGVRHSPDDAKGGRKVLLTMFARQFFPS